MEKLAYLEVANYLQLLMEGEMDSTMEKLACLEVVVVSLQKDKETQKEMDLTTENLANQEAKEKPYLLMEEEMDLTMEKLAYLEEVEMTIQKDYYLEEVEEMDQAMENLTHLEAAEKLCLLVEEID